MTIVCLDIDGMLRLEDWIAVAGKMGRTDFKRTIRDETRSSTTLRKGLDLLGAA